MMFLNSRAALAAAVTVGLWVCMFSCNEPTKPSDLPVATKFLFEAKSLPLPGYESTVDAVTKASHIYDTLRVKIDSFPSTDQISTVTIDWGDKSNPFVGDGTFPTGPSYVSFSHWYTRDADSITGICTTKVTVATVKGTIRDTTIRIKVLKKW